MTMVSGQLAAWLLMLIVNASYLLSLNAVVAAETCTARSLRPVSPLHAAVHAVSDQSAAVQRFAQYRLLATTSIS